MLGPLGFPAAARVFGRAERAEGRGGTDVALVGVREENQEQDVETRARRDGEGEGRIDSGAISISSRDGILLCQVQESPKVSYQTGVPQIRPRGQAPCALHRGQDEVMAMNS